MKMTLILVACFLFVDGYAATCQIEVVPPRVLACNAGLCVGSKQSQESEAKGPLNQPDQILIFARTAFVVVDEPFADSSTRPEKALRKALLKWGRFQLVEDVSRADIVIVMSDYSSSKRMMMERIKVHIVVFAGGRMWGNNATPLWSVEETGPAFGNKRPTRKLIEDLRKELADVEKHAAPPT